MTTDQRPQRAATPPRTPASRTTRSERTRDQLLAAAREVFVERGYDGATMDLIAERAGTARTTVFNHFAGKAELLRAVVVRESSELESALSRARGDTGKRLQAVLRGWGRSYDRDPVAAGALVRGWLATQAGGEVTEALPGGLLTNVLGDGQRAGEVPADLDVELLGAALFDACIGALARLGSEPAGRRRRSASHTLVAIGRHFARGLVPGATP